MATGQRAEPQTAKLMDPVCGLRIDPATAAATRVYGGVTYYFHSLACRDEFDGDPEQFAARAGGFEEDGSSPPPHG